MKEVAIKPVKGYNAFSKIINTGKKFKLEDMLMTVIYTDSDFSLLKSSQINTIYYGVSTSKKVNPNAVIRNRIKRLMRVSIKECMAKNPNYIDYLKYIILIYNKRIRHSGLIKLDDMEPIVSKIIKKSIDYKLKKVIE